MHELHLSLNEEERSHGISAVDRERWLRCSERRKAKLERLEYSHYVEFFSTSEDIKRREKITGFAIQAYTEE